MVVAFDTVSGFVQVMRLGIFNVAAFLAFFKMFFAVVT